MTKGLLANYVDQMAALDWVLEDLAQFGGDPSSTTTMGQIAGAACV